MDTHAPDSDTPYVAEVKERLRKHGKRLYQHVAAVHFFASWNEDVCKAW